MLGDRVSRKLAMAVTDVLPLILLGAFLHGFGLEIFSVNRDLSILSRDVRRLERK